jgi:hypothetical protein
MLSLSLKVARRNRTVFSGIKQWYQTGGMVGKTVVLVQTQPITLAISKAGHDTLRIRRRGREPFGAHHAFRTADVFNKVACGCSTRTPTCWMRASRRPRVALRRSYPAWQRRLSTQPRAGRRGYARVCLKYTVYGRGAGTNPQKRGYPTAHLVPLENLLQNEKASGGRDRVDYH